MRTYTTIAIVTSGMACWYAFAGSPEPRPEMHAPAPDVASKDPWFTDITPPGVSAVGKDDEGEEVRFTYTGTASCAASNCHGGDRSGGNRPPFSNDGHRNRDATWGGEYSIWLHEDPHARAYDVLYDPLSVDMVKKLGYSHGNAHEVTRCLNCHAVNVHPENEGTVADLRTTHQDGVGCEACHGPAGDWLDAHKQTDWADKSPAEKAALGFWNTDDVLTRTRICASCHVGGPGRDVDHDLIAAGHPRLSFEMSAYQAMQPKHWNDEANLEQIARYEDAPVLDPKSGKAALETKLWAVGQLVSAEASVAQTARRADKDNEHMVWPEFTEFGCYACHHDLKLDPEGPDTAAFRSWRQARGFPGRRAGRLPWNTWYTPGLDWIETPDELASEEEAVQVQLDRLRARDDDSLDPAAIADLHDRLEGLANEYGKKKLGFFDGSWRNAHRKMVAMDAPNDARESWDAATQAWLALAAFERADALGGDGNETLQKALAKLRDTLEFPGAPKSEPDYSSPKDFGEERGTLESQFEAVKKKIVGDGN